MRGVVQSAMPTHMSIEESKEFDFMWTNMLPNVKKTGNWKLNEQQEKEFKQQAAIMAVRMGIKPGDMGRFAAGLGLSGPISSVEQGMGQLKTITGLESQGVGHYGELMAKSGELRGMVDVQGAAKTEADMAALLTTATIDAGSVAKAGTSIVQVNRAKTQMLTKHPEVAKKLGITAADDIPTFLEKLAPGMAEASKPGGVGADIWLTQQGVNLQQSRQAINRLVKRLPILREHLKAARAPGNVGRGSDRREPRVRRHRAPPRVGTRPPPRKPRTIVRGEEMAGLGRLPRY